MSAPLTVYDAHAIVLLEFALAQEEIVCFRVPLLATAASNQDKHANQCLVEALPEPFSGTFKGNPADADGAVEWLERLVLGNGLSIEPGIVPLEVGTTSFWTTWGHCAFHGGVARIPYHEDHMTMLVRIKPRNLTL